MKIYIINILLCGVEVELNSNIIKLDRTSQRAIIKNLYFGGDGTGLTRGLMQASVNVILIAGEILKNGIC